MFEKFRRVQPSTEAVKARLIESGALPDESGRVGDLAVEAYRSHDDLGQESGIPDRVVGSFGDIPVPDLTSTEKGRATLVRLAQMAEAGVRAHGAGLRGEEVLKAIEAETRQNQADFPTEQ